MTFRLLYEIEYATVRGLSHSEGVDYEESYVPCTLHIYSDELRLHLQMYGPPFLSYLDQCTKCCDPLVTNCRDSLVVGFRGSLEIH